MKSTITPYLFLILFLVPNFITAQDIDFDETEIDIEPEPKYPRAMDTICWRMGSNFGFVVNQKDILIPFDYQKLSPTYNNFIVAKKDGKYGMINRRNEVRIPFEYDKLDSRSKNRIVAFKDGKAGIISASNEVLMPFNYEAIEARNSELFKARKYGKWGVINMAEEVIVPFDHSNIEISSNVIIAKKLIGSETRSGAYGLDGKLITPFDYNNTRAHYNEFSKKLIIDGKAPLVEAMTDKPGYHFYDKDGKILLKLPYENITALDSEYARFSNENKIGIVKVNKDVIYEQENGYIPWKEGDIVNISKDKKSYLYSVSKKSFVHDEYNGYGEPDQNGVIRFSIVKDRKKYFGLMNLDLEVLYGPELCELREVAHAGIYTVNKNKQLTGVINSSGSLVDFGFKHLRLRSFLNGFYAVYMDKNKWMLHSAKSGRLSEEIFVDYNRTTYTMENLRKRVENPDDLYALLTSQSGQKYLLLIDGSLQKYPKE